MPFCGSPNTWQSKLHGYLQEKNVPDWMQEQIEADLAPCNRNNMSKKALDALMLQEAQMGSHCLLARYRIINNQVYAELPANSVGHYRASIVTNALNILARNIKLPDVDFIVTMHDSLDHIPLSAPVFAFAKNPKIASHIVLIPDFEALNGYNELFRLVQIGNTACTWSQKRNQAVWRGSRTGGGHFKLDNFLEFPRSCAVTLSLQYPQLINAKFSLHAQGGGALQQYFSEYFGDTLSIPEQIQYKYQLLIDGNSCAYSGAYWRLASNCVVLKQASDSIQWYYRGISPYNHFIPINSDMSNLVEVIQWAIHHDEEAQEISRRAQVFVHENLNYERILQYLYVLLVQYAWIQNP